MVVADYGLTRILHDIPRSRTTPIGGGKDRFLAPELLRGKKKFETTTQTDIFALAMTIYDMWTLDIPRSSHCNDLTPRLNCSQGKRPPKPKNPYGLSRLAADRLWNLLTKMWHQDLAVRPEPKDFQRELEAIRAINY